MSDSRKAGRSGPGNPEFPETGTLTVWYLYIVACADGTLYTGIAKDIESRVKQHNSGKGARYTRGRLPVELVYSERVGTHGDALRRERQVKMMDLGNKRRLIEVTE